jgi:prevent-host-death family protein
MPKLKPSEDIRPLSEFRANVAAVVEHLQDTKRPVILTQRGRSAAVLLDVETYENLLEEIALLRDVRTAEAEVAAGQGLAHQRAKAHLLARIAR